MNDINSREEFEEFVETVAENNIKRDGSNARYVAESVITSIGVLDDDTATLTTVGEEYTDVRITPTQVLQYTLYGCEHPRRLPEGYRRAAVVLLRNEIKEATKNYRNSEE